MHPILRWLQGFGADGARRNAAASLRERDEAEARVTWAAARLAPAAPDRPASGATG